MNYGIFLFILIFTSLEFNNVFFSTSCLFGGIFIYCLVPELGHHYTEGLQRKNMPLKP